MISCKKQEILQKRLPNGVPKSDLKLGKSPFGTSGGTSGASGRFFAQKMWPKCSKSGPKLAKVTPKVSPKWQKWVPGNGQILNNDNSFGSWPGGLREALTIYFVKEQPTRIGKHYSGFLLVNLDFLRFWPISLEMEFF